MSGFTVASKHPEDLASGRTVAPGEKVPTGAVDLKDPHDKRLVDEGVLVKAEKKETS
jgi:hypothetical protein